MLRGLGAGGVSQRLQLFLGASVSAADRPRRYYGVNVGESDHAEVVRDSVRPGRDIELSVVYASLRPGFAPSRAKLVLAIRSLAEELTRRDWPPL